MKIINYILWLMKDLNYSILSLFSRLCLAHKS